MRFSVVVAVRDGAATLQRCLDSAFEQTYAEVEVIAIDGGSVDGTQAVLESNAAQIAFWQSEPDDGVYDAWNKALGHATGDWISFMGADDRYADANALSRVADALSETRDDCRVVYGSLDLVEPDGTVVRRLGRPWPEVRSAFRTGMQLPHPATFYHRSFFEEHGSFDQGFKIAGDYEMLLRDVLHRDPVFVVGPAIVEMAVGGVSDRPENRLLRATEDHRARKMHGLTTGPAWLSAAVMRAKAYLLVRRTLGARAAEAMVAFYRRVLGRGGR